MKLVAPVFYISLLLIALLPARSIAQNVAINNDGSLPNASAILDIKSSTKGMLIPRTSTASRLAIVNPPKGLVLYDSTADGFWFYNGTTWLALSSNNNAWSTTGNSGTDTAINFIGTKDFKPLRFRVNNEWAGVIDPGYANTVLGYISGQNLTTGYSNTALGWGTLSSVQTGYHNTAIGTGSLQINLGIDNTGIGAYSLWSNTSGTENTAAGAYALNSNSTGVDNTANGYASLGTNTTGFYNTAMGSYALAFNSTASSNIAIGYYSLHNQAYSNGQVTYVSNNVAIGISAMANNNPTTYLNGVQNTAAGNYSLWNNTTGSRNTAIGVNALFNNVAGDGNIAIGAGAGTGTGYLTNTINIGNAGYPNLASNQAFIGNTSTNWIGGQTTWFTYASDARVKNNVEEDVKGLAFISKLRPVTYNLNITAMRQISGGKETPDYPEKYDVEKIKQSGFIAQEVVQAAKETGYQFSGVTIPRNEHELYTMSYAQFVVPLVKGMQEQQKLIEELEKKLTALKTELDLLKAK